MINIPRLGVKAPVRGGFAANSSLICFISCSSLGPSSMCWAKNLPSFVISVIRTCNNTTLILVVNNCNTKLISVIRTCKNTKLLSAVNKYNSKLIFVIRTCKNPTLISVVNKYNTELMLTLEYRCLPLKGQGGGVLVSRT